MQPSPTTPALAPSKDLNWAGCGHFVCPTSLGLKKELCSEMPYFRIKTCRLDIPQI